MSEAVNILEILAQLDINAIGSPVSENDELKKYFIHVEITRDSENKQRPSNKVLSQAKKILKDLYDLDIEFLLNDTQSKDIEAGLRATLLHAYGSYIRNSFISIDYEGAHVWIDLKKSLDEDAFTAVKKKVADYFSSFNIQVLSLDNLNSEIAVPGNLVCLRTIRQLAPTNLATLKSELERLGFVVPSHDWLKRRLDALRKSNKVIWTTGGYYVLPMTTIRDLGTLKDRNSPDIRRFLRLARGQV